MESKHRDAYLTGIVQTYSSQLRAFIRNRVRDTDDADDILQDVFCQLANTTVNGGNDIEKISAWLYRVARNAILNLWRKQRELPLSALAEDEAFHNLSSRLFGEPGSEPENMFLRQLVWQELEFALSELPPEQSEVFCLTVFDGVPVKAIAESAGVPVATILSRKHYAVKALRVKLRGLYEDFLNL